MTCHIDTLQRAKWTRRASSLSNVALKCFARQVVSRHRLPFARLATIAFKSWCRFRNTRTTHETSRQSARPFLLVTSLRASAAKISGRCSENKCNWRGVVCFIPRERCNFVLISSHREGDEFVGGRGRNGMSRVGLFADHKTALSSAVKLCCCEAMLPYFPRALHVYSAIST